MSRPQDYPDLIPIFPLPGALLLPRARLPLHIFEPRYLAMIEDCMKTPHRLIGMVQPRDVPGTDPRPLHSIGCAGRLTAFSETEDGRYLITLTGKSRFRVREDVTGFTPYRRCAVDWSSFTQDCGKEETDPGLKRTAFFALLKRFFGRHKLSTDWDSLTDAEDELLINSLSMLCPFEPDDKQALLEAPSLQTRRETLVMLMEFSLRGGGADEVLQ
ncbi:MAG: LON peptidase substrate-binding domain-containing protein [Natronohydrobacter sp.]|nr:LON peptidase substrate-binding domain-containing protein [Natronohydrobacter sp.]